MTRPYSWKHWRLRMAAVAMAIALPLVLAEIVLRFLPVDSGLHTQPVNATNPVFRFKPNRFFLFSRGWNFSIINQGRVNNAGFVNNQDYTMEGSRPLLAVIGDSYVEAAMVPFAKTIHGRLAQAAFGRGRVYSFGASGAPLSQYLIWARFARKTYKADRLAIVVVGNDFDESLLGSSGMPGFHQYAPDGDRLDLRRTDYRPGPLRPLVYSSALARYLFFNLHLPTLLERLPSITKLKAAHANGAFVGNTATSADARRLEISEKVVERFFHDLPEYSSLAPQNILFVVDGIRYANADPSGTSYFSRMRRFFMAEAARRGYQTVDMDETFHPYIQAHPTARFEYPTDGHWNELAHGLAADAIIRSGAFPDLFSPPPFTD